jgi:hypothetical protein
MRTFLFLFLVAVNCCAQGVVVSPYRFAGGGGGSPTYLINQNFEGTGYDNGESWTEGGTWDEDYTTTVLTGSQSLFQDGLGGGSNTSPDFAPSSHFTLYLQFRLNTAVNNSELLVVRSGANADLANLVYRAGGTLRSSCGGVNFETSDAISTGQKIHVWIEFTKGTGANGLGSIGWSTDGTRPASGNKFAQTTSGDATADAVRIRLEANIGQAIIIDRIMLTASTIGDNP